LGVEADIDVENPKIAESAKGGPNLTKGLEVLKSKLQIFLQ
jgi:hypothetical protein